jgi:hypothetical protein
MAIAFYGSQYPESGLSKSITHTAGTGKQIDGAWPGVVLLTDPNSALLTKRHEHAFRASGSRIVTYGPTVVD